MVLKWLFIGDIRDETLHGHCSGDLGDRTLFELVEFYLGDVHEMAGNLVVTHQGETKWLLLQSPGNELFKLVGLQLRDGLEMAGGSTILLGETWHSHCCFTHIMILKCMSLCATWQSISSTAGKPYDSIRKWFLKKENNIGIIWWSWKVAFCMSFENVLVRQGKP